MKIFTKLIRGAGIGVTIVIVPQVWAILSPSPDIFSLVSLFAFMWFIWFYLPIAILGVQLYLSAPTRKEKDISPENTRYSVENSPMLNHLDKLGFRRLGETATLFPKSGDITTWLFIDETNTILAEVIVISKTPVAEAVNFSSFYGTTAILETNFPYKRLIRYKNLLSVGQEDGVENVYDTHRREMKNFSETHGEPHRIKEVEDVIKWNALHRKLYTKRVIRDDVLYKVGLIITMGVFMLAVVVALLASLAIDSESSGYNLLVLIRILTGLIFILAGGFYVVREGRKKKRMRRIYDM